MKKKSKKSTAEQEQTRTFGEVLRNARIDAKMNLRMAAEAMADAGFLKTVDHSSLSRYESGERLPRLEVFLALCNVYGVRPGNILTRAGLNTVEAPVSEILRKREDEAEIKLGEGEQLRCMVYIPDTIRDDAEELARARGIRFSELVRSLLRRELKAHVSRVSSRKAG